MTTEYQPVPVAIAHRIAEDYAKDIVVLVCWDAQYARLHTTTFGRKAEQKLHAAALGEILAEAAGSDLSQKHVYEDFSLDAARLKEENDQLRARLRELEARS